MANGKWQDKVGRQIELFCKSIELIKKITYNITKHDKTQRCERK